MAPGHCRLRVRACDPSKSPARLTDGDKGKQLVPVVIIYGQKRKRVELPSFPFSPRLNLLR